MARNEEKALTLFSKWDTFKRESHSDGGAKRRPFIASECTSLSDAEKWRRELVREVTKKVSAIQNASLGEHRIREMNDEINKLMKTKHHWDVRVTELGGNSARGKQFYEVDGKELPGAPGYKYYGAAKELPGVRELFKERDDEVEMRRRKRTRADMYKNITPDYYGYRDEDDGILVVKEAEREKELVAKAVAEFNEKKRRLIEDARRTGGVFGAAELALLEGSLDDNENTEGASGGDRTALALAQKFDVGLSGAQDGSGGVGAGGALTVLPSTLSAATNAELKAHVPVPTQEEIGAIVVDHKKKMLLDLYA